jgi:hypothetical protein
MCETGKEGVKMTEDKAVELINEWLELAKEVSDMNLNRMEYDEERYEYAMDRMDVIRKKNSRISRTDEQKKRGLNLSFDFFIFDEYNEIREGTPRGVASRI